MLPLAAPVPGGLFVRPLVLAIALIAIPLAPGADARLLPGCHAGPVESAAQQLVHPGAEVVRVDAEGALVLAPLVHPGTRFRLVEHEGAWCDAQRAQWTVGTPIERAAAYASVAAAPWFDGVTITSARELLPGNVALTTHARTNGIVAEWLVEVDPLGIRSASFTSVAIGIAPYEAETEGLTALPGLVRGFLRAPDGTLAATAPLLPTPDIQPVALDTMSDGFTIRFFHGETNAYPTTGGEITILDIVRAAARENYEEFLSWGLEKGWRTNEGRIYVDDDSALACFACVLVSQDFQIHLHSQAVPILTTLADAEYPDDRSALTTILGHEMFHNFQNAYNKPEGSPTYLGGAFMEGLARMQESLHTYSGASHQPASLVYKGTVNGCNFELAPEPHPVDFPAGSPVRWVATPTLADGPATGQTYSACDFWLTWYGHHGVGGLRDLLGSTLPHRESTGWTEFKGILETSAGAPVDDDLARFAAAILTGRGLGWPAADASGPTRDWGEHLGRWTPATLAPGESRTERLSDGGMMGARVEHDGVVGASPAASVALYVIRDDASIEPIARGAGVIAPAWIVAIHPGAGSANVTLAYA